MFSPASVCIAVYPLAWVGHSVASVCRSVCPRSKSKTAWAINTKLGSLVYIYSIVVVRHALNQRSKGQMSSSHTYENCRVRTVASDACCYGRVLLLLAWVCMSIWLPMFSSLQSVFRTNTLHRVTKCVVSRSSWAVHCKLYGGYVLFVEVLMHLRTMVLVLSFMNRFLPCLLFPILVLQLSWILACIHKVCFSVTLYHFWQ